MNTSSRIKGISALLLTVAMLMAIPTASGQGQAGTTLSVDKTATGVWTRTYSWTIDKSASPQEQTVKVWEEAAVEYTITATKGEAVEEGPFVAGTITVFNGPDGDRPTQDLKIVDQVEYKTGSEKFQPLPGATTTITPSEQLAPGEIRTYDYLIPFTPIPGATYRNTVKVTITNHSGHLGEEYGPEPKAEFSMPDGPVLVNDRVQVSDHETIPSGLDLVGSDEPAWPQQIDGTKTIEFTKRFVSGSAGTYVVRDVATVSCLDGSASMYGGLGIAAISSQAGDMLDQAEATATITVVDPNCPPITGAKFYDINLNGVWDEGEPPLKGWKVRLQGDGLDLYAFTDSQGVFAFWNVPPGSYTITEIFPYCPQWVPTTDTSFDFEVGLCEGYSVPPFGNVCVLPAFGGRTIRYWSSTWGQGLITPEDLEQLGLATAAELAEFLRTASLKEFTHMLAAQLIATRLNILHGRLDEETIVYLGPLGFKSIAELVAEAVLALDDDMPQKEQEFNAKLLEGLNYNKWPFLSLNPCPVLYAD